MISAAVLFNLSFRFSVVFFLLIVFNSGCFAASPANVLMLSPANGSVISPENVQVFVDSNSQFTIDDVLGFSSISALGFSPIKQGFINFGFSDSRFWLKTSVVNSGDIKGEWKLSFGLHSAKVLNVYKLNAGEVVQLLSWDEEDTFYDRVFDNRLLYADVKLEAGESAEILIEYASFADTVMNLELLTLKELEYKDQRDLFFVSVFSGVMVSLLVFNLLLAAASKKIIFVYYVLMHSIGLLGAIIPQGYPYQYFWPHRTAYVEQIFSPLGSIVYVMLAMLFASKYLQLKSVSKSLYTGMAVYVVGLFFLLLISPFLDPVDLQKLNVYNHYLGSMIIMAVASYAFFVRQPYSGYFLLGWLCLVVSNAFIGFEKLGYQVIGFPVPFDLKLGLLLEALFIAIGLTTRLYKANKYFVDGLESHAREAEELVAIEYDKNQALSHLREKPFQVAAAGERIRHRFHAIRQLIARYCSEIANKGFLDHFERNLDYADSMLHELIYLSDDKGGDVNKSVSIYECFLMLYQQHFFEAREKGLILKFQRTSVVLDLPPLPVIRVLDNLIKNSIRYTNKGKVVVGVRRRVGGVEIQVLDTGQGVEAGTLKLLQQPFVRAVEASAEGYGLGLAIVKSLCDELGVELSVHSRLGVGSSFCIFIPASLQR